MRTIKVFLVDDHRTMTDGLTEYFRIISNPECIYQVIGRVHSGTELLERLSRMPAFDVLIADLEMPEMSGFELLERVRLISANLPMIILTMHNSWSFANEAIQKGARGYVLKTSGGRTITEAIDVVLNRQIFIDRSIDTGGTAQIPVEWNAEDRQIVCLILEELTSQQIGEQINRSEEFVEGRRRSLIKTIGCKNVVGIVKYALRKGICPDPGGVSSPAFVAPVALKPATGSIRVFLVDDHALLLDSLKAMLRHSFPGLPAIEIVGSAGSGSGALEGLALLDEVEVVLLDKELPDINGIALIGKIKETNPAVQTVMLSFDGSVQTMDAALAAGAFRYLVKTKASREDIVRAIVEAAQGRNPVPVPRPAHSKIEWEDLDLRILKGVMDEMSNEEISKLLDKSLSTVAHRRARMVEMVGARSVVGLAVYAYRMGLY